MTARFHHDCVRRADVEPEHFEKHRVGRLHAVGNHDDRDIADLDRRRRAKHHCSALRIAQPANDGAIVKADDFRLRLERRIAWQHVVRIKLSIERGANARLMGTRC